MHSAPPLSTVIMDLQRPQTKTIIFMRHARAPMQAGMNDKDRVLDGHGEAQALLIGKQLAQASALPDQVICSPAQRTRQTFNLLGQSWPQLQSVKTEYPQPLYNAATGDIFALLQELPEDINRVMIVGHNPGVPGIIDMLWDGLDKTIDDMMIMAYPPASVTIMQQQAQAGQASSWRDMQPKSFRILNFLTP